MGLVLLLALIVRFLLLPLPPFGIDMNDWMAWANHILEVGPGQFYATTWSDYLPGYLYVLWFLAAVHKLVSFFPYEILLKLPAVAADLGIGWLIYRIVREQFNSRNLGRSIPEIANFKDKSDLFAILVSSLYLFNPFAFFNSSVWGQVDSVFAFLLLLSVYLLTKKTVKRFPEFREFNSGNPRVGNEKLLAWGVLGLAFLLKPQAIFFLPIFLIFFLKDSRNLGRLIPGILKDTFLFLVTIFLLSLPFFPNSPFFGLPALIVNSSNTYPFTSVFAMNLWGVVGPWKSDSATLFNLTYQVLGLIFLGLGLLTAWGIGAIRIIRGIGGNRKIGVYLSAALITLSFFMLPTRVHERWFYAFFPFFLTYAALSSRWQNWFIYFLLSIIHFLNLYFVYTYYTVNFLKIEIVSNFIGKYFNWFSLISFLLFSWFLTLSLKERGIGEKN